MFFGVGKDVVDNLYAEHILLVSPANVKSHIPFVTLYVIVPSIKAVVLLSDNDFDTSETLVEHTLF